MKILKKILLGIGAAVVLGVAGLTIYIATHQHPTAEAPYPEIHASKDPAAIERGKHIVFVLGNCAYCHADQTRMAQVEKGEEVALSGGREERMGPIGTGYFPNITSDVETGIGSWSDPEIARAIRHSVKKGGGVMIPFMEMQHMCDDDLTAVVSYLRSTPPVKNKVRPWAFKAMGKAVIALMMQKPKGPERAILKSVPAGPSVEHGRYLAQDLVRCDSCHTRRSKMTGAYLNQPFSGGDELGRLPNIGEPPFVFHSVNLTSDPATGRLAKFTEEEFVKRFRAGRIYEGSPMPWPMFGHMSDDEIRSIYRFLQSLPPVVNDTGVNYDPNRK